MQVIGHHGIRQHIDGEGPGCLADQIADPFPAVLGVIAAEEGAADAPGDDVEAAWTVVGYQETAGDGLVSI